MNESEVRDTLREAFGEADYPTSLRTRVESRLGRPGPRVHPDAVSVVAGLLAVLIVVSLVYVRLEATHPVPTVTHPSPVTTPQSQIPDHVLASGGLAAAQGVITRLNLSQTQRNRTITIVAAYADPRATIVISRAQPVFAPADEVSVNISDDFGSLDVGGSGWGGDGYEGMRVDQGPHTGPDGIAHLHVAIVDAGVPFFPRPTPTTLSLRTSPNPVSPSPLRWDFSFDVRVQPAVPLTMQPPLTSVGAWQFTVEAFELTPGSIYFQGLIRDATGFDPFSSITLLDEADRAHTSSGGSFGPVTEAPGSPMRFAIHWARPAVAATLRLQISYGTSAASTSRPGAQYTISLSVPPPPQS